MKKLFAVLFCMNGRTIKSVYWECCNDAFIYLHLYIFLCILIYIYMHLYISAWNLTLDETSVNVWVDSEAVKPRLSIISQETSVYVISPACW